MSSPHPDYLGTDEKGVKWRIGGTYYYTEDNPHKYKITKGPDVREGQYVYEIVGVDNPTAKHQNVSWTELEKSIFKTIRVNGGKKYSIEINERGEEVSRELVLDVKSLDKKVN